MDLGPTGGGAAPLPSSTAFALGSGGFANKATVGVAKKVDKAVRENSKVTIPMELKTKGAAYFHGEITVEFAVFGSEGKVTGALQKGNGKVFTTIQMVSRYGTQAVTTSFNLMGVVNKEGVYQGTFTATEISKNAGTCSGLFKANKVLPPSPDSDEEEKAAPAKVLAFAGGPCCRRGKAPLTGHCVKMLKHEGGVRGLAVLQGGNLVSGGYNNTHLRMWDPAMGVNVATMVGKGKMIAALPGGRFAAAGFDTKKTSVWDPSSPAHPICEYTGHTSDVLCVASLPDNLVASGSKDKTVHIWRADTGAHVATLQGHTHYVFALAVLTDGRLASCSWDKTVRLWDVSHPAFAPRVLQHGNWVFALAALDGGILASGCWDSKVYLWDVKSASDQPIALLEGHESAVCSLAALPRGLLASGSFDTTVRVWNVAARTCAAVLQGHSGGVGALAALPDGRLASGSDDKDIRVWELRPPPSPFLSSLLPPSFFLLPLLPFLPFSPP